MSTRDYIPRKDEEFHNWQEQFITYLGNKFATYGLTSEEFDTLIGPQDAWRTAWAKVLNPATNTSLATQDKKAARAAYEADLRAFVKRYLIANPAVTNAEREGLGLPVYKDGRTPSPVPTTYPDFTIDTTILRQLTIHFREHGKKTSAKPDGIHGAEILWAILDTAPASLNDLTRSGFDTHSPFTLTFDENQRGKIVYFALRWENTRGDKGPWSPITHAVIP
ncbi:hypothetical protein OpiT1DRAFT_05082 [Opitutaceae bacterium TAV1]|nr:hypothetical protein OpiT1DRAFT_05082 [Opitutaceae bacterium TAV1]